MNLPEELKALAEEFRLYARAECGPASVEQWNRWADTCEAGGKNLANRDDYWPEIERIGKEVGIEPDNSLRSESLTEPRWSRNDPCDDTLWHQDEVVDAIIKRIRK